MGGWAEKRESDTHLLLLRLSINVKKPTCLLPASKKDHNWGKQACGTTGSQTMHSLAVRPRDSYRNLPAEQTYLRSQKVLASRWRSSNSPRLREPATRLSRVGREGGSVKRGARAPNGGATPHCTKVPAKGCPAPRPPVPRARPAPAPRPGALPRTAGNNETGSPFLIFIWRRKRAGLGEAWLREQPGRW